MEHVVFLKPEVSLRVLAGGHRLALEEEPEEAEDQGDKKGPLGGIVFGPVGPTAAATGARPSLVGVVHMRVVVQVVVMVRHRSSRPRNPLLQFK